MLDVSLGNTDNHARNTSVLKKHDGTIELSPVYDVAPMILDPRGIARVCRWADNADFPKWNDVADSVAEMGLDARATKRWLRELADRVGELPKIMRDCHTPKRVVDSVRERIRRVEEDLAKVGRS